VLYRVTRWYLKFHRFLRSRAETDAAGDVAKKKPRSVMTCMPAMPKLRNPTPTCDLGCVPRFPGWANQRGSVSSDLDDTEDVTCEICFESDESPETAIFQRGSPQSNATLSKLLRRRTAASSKVQVIVSDGTQPGDLVRFDYNGLEYDVVVPDGVFAGMRFMADVAPPSTTDVEPSSLSHTVATVSAAVVCVKVWVKSVTLSAAVVISCAPVIVQRLAKRCRRSRHASV
jgi:hypothetical protein